MSLLVILLELLFYLLSKKLFNKVMNSFKYLKCGFVVMYTYNEKSALVWSGIVLRQFWVVLTTLRQFMAVYGKCQKQV